MAKFPARDDDRDIGTCEYVAQFHASAMTLPRRTQSEGSSYLEITQIPHAHADVRHADADADLEKMSGAWPSIIGEIEGNEAGIRKIDPEYSLDAEELAAASRACGKL